ncbi:MAG: hypothetical protein Q9216_007129 [Gyalolechia sp. 2 TL-2023]
MRAITPCTRLLAPRSRATNKMINPLIYWHSLIQQLSTIAAKTTPPIVDQAPNRNPREDYFHYTRGRFVCNEGFETSQRRVQFNVNELCRVATEAAGSESCAKVEKYPDGMYNKNFLFAMHDGTEVVGKVPNPNAGRPHFTTASEVATMDFVRNVLSTPAPKVLTWNANVQNPVGAEYILMEKMAGIQLHHVWPSLDMQVTRTIAGKKSKTLALLSDHVPGENSSTMAVLQSALIEDLVSRSGCGCLKCRQLTTVHPGSTVDEYKRAIGRREIESIRSLPRLPKSPLTLCGPHSYEPTPEKKIAALENYLRLVKYVLPTDDSITRSNLWHPDLHSENIYVDADDPTRIVGLIDWQSADLLPLFDHARQPYILDYDSPQLKGLERPTLSENQKGVPPDERQRALALYHSSSLVALYRRFIHNQIKPLYHAMEYRDTISYDMLLLAQNLLVDGEAHYQAHVTNLHDVWADLPGVRSRGNPPFPFQFTDEDLAVIENDVAAASRGMEYMESLKQKLGDLWPEKGLVRHDQYEDAKKAIQQAKLELYDQLGLNEEERAKWDERWPFNE